MMLVYKDDNGKWEIDSFSAWFTVTISLIVAGRGGETGLACKLQNEWWGLHISGRRQLLLVRADSGVLHPFSLYLGKKTTGLGIKRLRRISGRPWMTSFPMFLREWTLSPSCHFIQGQKKKLRKNPDLRWHITDEETDPEGLCVSPETTKLLGWQLDVVWYGEKWWGRVALVGSRRLRPWNCIPSSWLPWVWVAAHGCFLLDPVQASPLLGSLTGSHIQVPQPSAGHTLLTFPFYIVADSWAPNPL